MVIGPSEPRVKSEKAASTSWERASSDRDRSFSAAADKKDVYGAKPVFVGSMAERMLLSSDGEEGGRPRAL